MKALLLVAAFALTPWSAHAHWQQTRWGMTEAEVTRAMRGSRAASPEERGRFSTVRTGGAGLDALVVGTYSANGFTFTSVFLFAQARLRCVRLYLADAGRVPALRGELTRIYGAPDRVTRSVFTAEGWDRGDTIDLLEMQGGPSTLTYCGRERGGL